MLRLSLVTILAREMRLKCFCSRPTFGDVASGASHDISARNAFEIFSSRPSFGEVGSAASHDIGAENAIESFFEVDEAFEMLRVPLVTIIGARNAIESFSSRPSFGDVASGASHDIGARNAIESFLKSTDLWRCCECRWSRHWRRNAIEIFFNYIWCQTANNVTSRARKISSKFVEKMSIFNRIYRANIVTSGPRSTSKACFVKKLSIVFLGPTS